MDVDSLKTAAGKLKPKTWGEVGKFGAKVGAGVFVGLPALMGLGSMIAHPIDTAKDVAVASSIASSNPGTIATGVGAAALVGAAAYGIGKNTTLPGVKAVGKAVGGAALGTASTVGEGFSLGHRAMEKVQSSVMNRVANSWDNKGKVRTFKTAMKMGAVYGAAFAAVDMSLDRHVSDEAMSRAQESGIYEGGSKFGSRSSNTLKTLGSSAQGIGFGLWNSR